MLRQFIRINHYSGCRGRIRGIPGIKVDRSRLVGKDTPRTRALSGQSAHSKVQCAAERVLFLL